MTKRIVRIKFFGRIYCENIDKYSKKSYIKGIYGWK